MVGVKAVVVDDTEVGVQAHINFSPFSENIVPSDEDERKWLSCVSKKQDGEKDIFETLPQRQGSISFSPLCCDSPLSPRVRIPTPNFTPKITPLVELHAVSNTDACCEQSLDNSCVASIHSVSSKNMNIYSKLYAEELLTPVNPQQSRGVQTSTSCSQRIHRRSKNTIDHAPSSIPRPPSRDASRSMSSSRRVGGISFSPLYSGRTPPSTSGIPTPNFTPRITPPSSMHTIKAEKKVKASTLSAVPIQPFTPEATPACPLAMKQPCDGEAQDKLVKCKLQVIAQPLSAIKSTEGSKKKVLAKPGSLQLIPKKQQPPQRLQRSGVSLQTRQHQFPVDGNAPVGARRRQVEGKQPTPKAAGRRCSSKHGAILPTPSTTSRLPPSKLKSAPSAAPLGAPGAPDPWKIGLGEASPLTRLDRDQPGGAEEFSSVHIEEEEELLFPTPPAAVQPVKNTIISNMKSPGQVFKHNLQSVPYEEMELAPRGSCFEDHQGRLPGRGEEKFSPIRFEVEDELLCSPPSSETCVQAERTHESGLLKSQHTTAHDATNNPAEVVGDVLTKIRADHHQGLLGKISGKSTYSPLQIDEEDELLFPTPSSAKQSCRREKDASMLVPVDGSFDRALGVNSGYAPTQTPVDISRGHMGGGGGEEGFSPIQFDEEDELLFPTPTSETQPVKNTGISYIKSPQDSFKDRVQSVPFGDTELVPKGSRQEEPQKQLPGGGEEMFSPIRFGDEDELLFPTPASAVQRTVGSKLASTHSPKVCESAAATPPLSNTPCLRHPPPLPPASSYNAESISPALPSTRALGLQASATEAASKDNRAVHSSIHAVGRLEPDDTESILECAPAQIESEELLDHEPDSLESCKVSPGHGASQESLEHSVVCWSHNMLFEPQHGDHSSPAIMQENNALEAASASSRTSTPLFQGMKTLQQAAIKAGLSHELQGPLTSTPTAATPHEQWRSCDNPLFQESEWRETPILSAVAMLSNIRTSHKPSSTNPTPWRVSWEDLQVSDLFPCITPSSSSADSGSEHVKVFTRCRQIDGPPNKYAHSPLCSSLHDEVATASAASPETCATADCAFKSLAIVKHHMALPQKEHAANAHGHESMACMQTANNGGAGMSTCLLGDAMECSTTTRGGDTEKISAFQSLQASTPTVCETPACSESSLFDKVTVSALDTALTPNPELQMSLEGWGHAWVHQDVSGSQQKISQQDPRGVGSLSARIAASRKKTDALYHRFAPSPTSSALSNDTTKECGVRGIDLPIDQTSPHTEGPQGPNHMHFTTSNAQNVLQVPSLAQDHPRSHQEKVEGCEPETCTINHETVQCKEDVPAGVGVRMTPRACTQPAPSPELFINRAASTPNNSSTFFTPNAGGWLLAPSPDLHGSAVPGVKCSEREAPREADHNKHLELSVGHKGDIFQRISASKQRTALLQLQLSGQQCRGGQPTPLRRPRSASKEEVRVVRETEQGVRNIQFQTPPTGTVCKPPRSGQDGGGCNTKRVAPESKFGSAVKTDGGDQALQMRGPRLGRSPIVHHAVNPDKSFDVNCPGGGAESEPASEKHRDVPISVAQGTPDGLIRPITGIPPPPRSATALAETRSPCARHEVNGNKDTDTRAANGIATAAVCARNKASPSVSETRARRTSSVSPCKGEESLMWCDEESLYGRTPATTLKPKTFLGSDPCQMWCEEESLYGGTPIPAPTIEPVVAIVPSPNMHLEPSSPTMETSDGVLGTSIPALHAQDTNLLPTNIECMQQPNTQTETLLMLYERFMRQVVEGLKSVESVSASPIIVDPGEWKTILEELHKHSKTFSEPESLLGDSSTQMKLACKPGLAQGLARHASDLVRVLQCSSCEAVPAGAETKSAQMDDACSIPPPPEFKSSLTSHVSLNSMDDGAGHSNEAQKTPTRTCTEQNLVLPAVSTALLAHRADCQNTNMGAQVGTCAELIQLANENKCLYSMQVLALKDNALMHMRIKNAEQNLCKAWSRVAELELDRKGGHVQQAENRVLSRNTTLDVPNVTPTPDPVRRLLRLAAADTPANSSSNQILPQKDSTVLDSLSPMGSSVALANYVQVPRECAVATSTKRTLRALRDVTNTNLFEDTKTIIEPNSLLRHADGKQRMRVGDEVVVNRQLFAEYQNSIRSRYGVAQ